MTYVQSLLGILLSAILTENFILVKFYGKFLPTMLPYIPGMKCQY